IGVVRLRWDSGKEPERTNREKNLLSFAADNICLEIMRREGAGFSFCDLNGDVILIFQRCEEGGEEHSPAVVLAGECADSIRRYLKISTAAAVCGSQRDYAQAHSGYEEARRLLDYGMILQDDRVVTPGWVERQRLSLTRDVELD